MLKVYDVTDYVSIDGAPWREVGSCGYRVTDKEQEKNKLILDNVSFDEAREYLSDNAVDGVWKDITFFKKKPTIGISYCGSWDSVYYKHFNSISYKQVVTEWKNVSIDWLIQHLSADQFIQYLKERGMTTCPILK